MFNSINTIKTLVITSLILLASIGVASAHDDRLKGWAWSPNYGWISFNCDNEDTCSEVNYFVDIDRETGNLSGYAWSYNVGWISFQENDYPDIGETSALCAPGSSCFANDQNGCSACYNFRDTNYSMNGWAKVIGWGDDGWIRLDHGRSGYAVTVDPTRGHVHGFAWGSNDMEGDQDPETGTGWISMNCADTITGCSDISYYVRGISVNDRLVITEMSAPNWSAEESCSAYGSLQSFLEWEVDPAGSGGCAMAYHIIVNDSFSTSSPILDTGKCEGTFTAENGCFGGYDGAACQANVDSARFNLKAALARGGASSTAELEYGKPYSWWLKLWDERGLESAWYQYDLNDNGVLTNGQTENNAESTQPNLTFTTYYHKFPNPSFTWAPTYPNIGENVYFQDATKYYKTQTGDNQHTCNDTFCDYAWTFEQAIPNVSTDRNPSEIKFLQGGSMNVSITVTDNKGYTCSNSADIENVSVCLPLWQEKKP